MSEPTPGPWSFQKRFGTVFTTTNPVTGTGSTNAIASVCCERRDRGSLVGADEAIANARLIAAAPEMLEALREMAPENPYDHDGCCFRCGRHVDQAHNEVCRWVRARAAIAKATGEPTE